MKQTNENKQKKKQPLFTHSQYNFTIYLHTQILWRSNIQLAARYHVAQYLNQSYMTKKWFICSHIEL